MSVSEARSVAREVVSRVRERGAYAHEALDAVVREHSLSERDTALATRLAYGTISYRGTLDAVVARYVRSMSGLEPIVADVLALCAYEILFMRTPSHAAVSQGVELVRAVRPRAAGLANAVLRRLSEDAEGFPWTDGSDDVVSLATSTGHPEWLARRWVEELGLPVATEVMQADNEPAPLFLAHIPGISSFEVVLEELDRAGASPEPGVVPGSIVAGDPAAAIRSTPLIRHDVLVVDAGAQFVARAVPLPESGRVVELGAGRGTKTLLMAARARFEGRSVAFTAVDVHGFKLEVLSTLAAEMGIPGIETVVADATQADALGLPEPGTVDAVLIDAPCSGLGTLRRHPDRRWRALEGESESLALVGAALLSTAAALVKPGGFVVYSTCTLLRRENHEVVDAFLKSEQGQRFRLDSLSADVPQEWSACVDDQGRFLSLPADGGPDGHFAARIVAS